MAGMTDTDTTDPSWKLARASSFILAWICGSVARYGTVRTIYRARRAGKRAKVYRARVTVDATGRDVRVNVCNLRVV